MIPTVASGQRSKLRDSAGCGGAASTTTAMGWSRRADACKGRIVSLIVYSSARFPPTSSSITCVASETASTPIISNPSRRRSIFLEVLPRQGSTQERLTAKIVTLLRGRILGSTPMGIDIAELASESIWPAMSGSPRKTYDGDRGVAFARRMLNYQAKVEVDA